MAVCVECEHGGHEVTPSLGRVAFRGSFAHVPCCSFLHLMLSWQHLLNVNPGHQPLVVSLLVFPLRVGLNKANGESVEPWENNCCKVLWSRKGIDPNVVSVPGFGRSVF